jgi:hypothetical protein
MLPGQRGSVKDRQRHEVTNLIAAVQVPDRIPEGTGRFRAHVAGCHLVKLPVEVPIAQRVQSPESFRHLHMTLEATSIRRRDLSPAFEPALRHVLDGG